jgi:hypothetical protein
MKGSKQKTGRKDLKLKRDPPPRGFLREILQRGAGSSGEPSGEIVATSEPAVELPVESRKEPVAENLPEAQQKSPLLRISSTDIPLKGADFPSKPAAGEGAGHLFPRVSGPRLAKKALSGCAKRKLKKARAGRSQAETGGSLQLGTAGSSKQGDTPTETLRRPRSEGSTPTEAARTPKRPRDSKGPGTYKEALAKLR